MLEVESTLTLKHRTTYFSEIAGRNLTNYKQKIRVIGSRIHFSCGKTKV